MRFLADMGVDTRIVKWLREKGHDASHLRDEGLHRMPNGKIFDKAISENRVILTFDLDFAEIVALSKGEKASVVLFRLNNTRTSNLINRLETVLSESGEALDRGGYCCRRIPASRPISANRKGRKQLTPVFEISLPIKPISC